MRLKKNEVLVLRRVKKDMTSHGGFKYPKKGLVEAPDWNPKPICGGGLHGLLWGEGSFNIESYGELFMVIKAEKADVVDLGDKCKFKKGRVVFVGEQKKAIDVIVENCPHGTIVNYCYSSEKNSIVGYKSTQTAGYKSTQTAGYKSTQTAGDKSTQTAGYKSTQTAGDKSTQTAGYKSTQTAGYKSTQTAGDESTQTAGYKSTQTAGYKSTQTAGYKSTQTAGSWSTQTAGDESTQTAGVNSVQIIQYYEDGKYKVKTRIVTEKEADRAYKFYNGDWHEVKDES